MKKAKGKKTAMPPVPEYTWGNPNLYRVARLYRRVKLMQILNLRMRLNYWGAL